jgi:hypothetical protein
MQNMKNATISYAHGDSLWLDYFAQATHTMVDTTSPAHMQNGVPLEWPRNFREHGDLPNSTESDSNMTSEIRKQDIQMIRQMWETMTGKKLNCGCEK